MAKFALVIGVSDYEAGWTPLPAAVKDVAAIRDVLLHPEIGGFAETDVVQLNNPNRQAMEEAIEMLFGNRHKDDLILLFFSGHGIKDDAGKLYFATAQTRKTQQGELVRSSAVAASFVHENMGRSRSKRQVVILDSCFSGAFAEGLSAKDDGSLDLRSQLGGEGRAILTSSSATQYSFAEHGEELSLYTRFIIEGIRTGEADLDGDDVISIDELHEYANRKVREIKPELKPEIYAMREGFKIRLAKVPIANPRERYQKEVARCGKRGELSIVNRSILNAWRTKLNLSTAAALALEEEILEPYRKEFKQKLQHYEQVVRDVLERDGDINDSTRQELNHLQHVLELRNEDTVPIENRIAAMLKRQRQYMQIYAEAYAEALREAVPPTSEAQSRLQQTRQQLSLAERDVAAIEARLTAEREGRLRNLKEYGHIFATALQLEDPLSDSKQRELRQDQSRLGLTDAEIELIEQHVKTQKQEHRQRLKCYQEAWINSTQRQRAPDQEAWAELQQIRRSLQLSEAEAKAVDEMILAEIESYQANLRRYGQLYAEAVDQHYPLSPATRLELQRHQQTLGLAHDDLIAIEAGINSVTEERLQRIQQYQQVFTDLSRFEFPVSEHTREELQRLQHLLELNDDVVANIEQQVIAGLAETHTDAQNLEISPQASPSPKATPEQQPQAEASQPQPMDKALPRQSERKRETPPVQPQYRKEQISVVATACDVPPAMAEPPTEAFQAGPGAEEPGGSERSRRQTASWISHHFWALWIAIYSFASAIGWAVCNSIWESNNVTNGLTNALTNAIGGAIYGLVLGGLQSLLIHRVNSHIKTWLPLTIAGCAIGNVLAIPPSLWLLNHGMPYFLMQGIQGLIFGTCQGLAQYQALKSLGHQTSRWFRRIIFAETAAAAFGFGIFAEMYGPQINPARYDAFTTGLIGGLVGGAIAGLFTGRLLLRLLSIPSDPKVNA